MEKMLTPQSIMQFAWGALASEVVTADFLTSAKTISRHDLLDLERVSIVISSH